jgi:hypothetical protein
LSNETYKTQALRLTERLAKHGINLPRADILDTVASLHGEKNWATLRQTEERTLIARLRARVMGELGREHVLTAEQLLYQMVPGEFQLGVSRDRRRILSLGDPWFLRHLTIIGQNGVGVTTMMESLIAQQILRGGGLLFIDPWQCRDAVDTFASFAGRMDDVEIIDLGNPTTGSACLSEKKISYVDVPLLSTPGRTPRQVHELFDAFWAKAAEMLARRDRFKLPFMVIVPESGTFLDAQWQMRYACARALGISVITHAQSIPSMARANSDVADIVIENNFTRIFFRQPSAAAIDAAVQTVEVSGSIRPTGPSVKERLVSLQMGEMLVSGYELLEDANTFLMNFRRQTAQPQAEPQQSPSAEVPAGPRH